MVANRLSPGYWNGIEEYIKFVKLANNPSRIKCLCIRCACIDKVMVEV